MAAGRRVGRAQVELRHLRYFLAIVEEMNYGRAAERLAIAQPGLSQQIKGLEDILGTPLLDRSRRAVRLTLAGEFFAAEARKAVAQVDRALMAARRAGRGELGRLSIGYVGSAAYTGVLTTLVAEFRTRYPEVALEIAELEMVQQLAQIAEGRLDVGFVRPPVPLPLGVASVPVLHEAILLAVRATHPLAQGAHVRLGDFAQETFITPRHAPDVSFHRYTTDACREVGFLPRLGPQGRDFVTIASMVSVGLGVALVPQSVRCIQLPGIAYRALAGPAPQAELAVAFRKGDPSPVVRAFARHARTYGAGEGGDREA